MWQPRGRTDKAVRFYVNIIPVLPPRTSPTDPTLLQLYNVDVVFVSAHRVAPAGTSTVMSAPSQNGRGYWVRRSRFDGTLDYVFFLFRPAILVCFIHCDARHRPLALFFFSFYYLCCLFFTNRLLRAVRKIRGHKLLSIYCTREVQYIIIIIIKHIFEKKNTNYSARSGDNCSSHTHTRDFKIIHIVRCSVFVRETYLLRRYTNKNIAVRSS